MFAAMLFAISAVAMSQFGMYYWRAVLASVASQPISESVLAAVSAENRPLRAEDFAQFDRRVVDELIEKQEFVGAYYEADEHE